MRRLDPLVAVAVAVAWGPVVRARERARDGAWRGFGLFVLMGWMRSAEYEVRIRDWGGC